MYQIYIGIITFHNMRQICIYKAPLPPCLINLLAIAVHTNLFWSYTILGAISQVLDLDPKVVFQISQPGGGSRGCRVGVLFGKVFLNSPPQEHTAWHGLTGAP